MAARTAGSGVASPCINICRMLQPSGWCEGCLRTLDEITAWGAMDDAGKRAVLLRLGPRRMARRAERAADRAADQAADQAADLAADHQNAAGPGGADTP